MATTSFIEHRGRKIAYFDCARVVDRDEVMRRIAKARTFVGAQPEKSVLTRTVVEGSRFDREITDAIKALAQHNRPFVVGGGGGRHPGADARHLPCGDPTDGPSLCHVRIAGGGQGMARHSGGCMGNRRVQSP